MTRSVGIVLFPDMLMLDVAGPMEVFSIANRFLKPEDGYRISTIAFGERAVRCSNGIVMQAELLGGQVADGYDVLLVPGGPGAYGGAHGELCAWLANAARASRRYGAICTGAFILGEAGLLDDQRVTTHWHYLERLARRFPRARVEADKIFIADGELLSSGGVTAGIDLALSILTDDHGKKLALDVAKVLLVVMKRQGGQAQFSPLLPEAQQNSSPIAQVQQFVIEHIQEPFSVERMAGLANMGARNFARVFAREVNMTPMEFVLSARIDCARNLLESGELPLKTVAFRSGFGSTRHMRSLFNERLGLTPAQYRYQFG